MTTKKLCFPLLMLNHICAKFDLILTSKVNPSCDVTTFVKGAQNTLFSFHIFSRDFHDSEGSYLWNGNKYQQRAKNLFLVFLWSFILADKNIIKNF